MLFKDLKCPTDLLEDSMTGICKSIDLVKKELTEVTKKDSLKMHSDLLKIQLLIWHGKVITIWVSSLRLL